jgi:hypothetical protein
MDIMPGILLDIPPCAGLYSVRIGGGSQGEPENIPLELEPSNVGGRKSRAGPARHLRQAKREAYLEAI